MNAELPRIFAEQNRFYDTSLSGMLSRIEDVGVTAAPKGTTDLQAATHWRNIFHHITDYTPTMAKTVVRRSLTNLARLDDESKLAETMGNSIALYAYKAGKQQWKKDLHVLPLDTLQNLYADISDITATNPKANARSLARPFLLLVDTFHNMGPTYHSNYDTNDSGYWNAQNMRDVVGYMIRTNKQAPAELTQICLCGVEGIKADHDSAISTLDSPANQSHKKPAPCTKGAGFSYPRISMSDVRD